MMLKLSPKPVAEIRGRPLALSLVSLHSAGNSRGLARQYVMGRVLPVGLENCNDTTLATIQLAQDKSISNRAHSCLQEYIYLAIPTIENISWGHEHLLDFPKYEKNATSSSATSRRFEVRNVKYNWQHQREERSSYCDGLRSLEEQACSSERSAQRSQATRQRRCICKCHSRRDRFKSTESKQPGYTILVISLFLHKIATTSQHSPILLYLTCAVNTPSQVPATPN